MQTIKYMLITLCVFFNFVSFGSSDQIELLSTVSPLCDISFDPEPIASNLDLTTTQNNLYLGRLLLNTNGVAGSPYKTIFSFDLNSQMTQSTSSHQFTLASVNINHQYLGSLGTIPLPLNGSEDNDWASVWWDFSINYSGIPALSLVQGNYNVEWFASCSLELRN